MRTSTLLAGILTALTLTACGGDSDTPAPSRGDTGVTDASANAQASDTASADEAPAADASQQPEPKKKRVRRPRINMPVLKALMGSEPAAPKPPVEATPALVALGRKLYHDASLSVDGAVSCASCHDLAHYGVEAEATKVSVGGRNTPTTYNAFLQFRQGWDGRAATVEELATVHAQADAATLVGKIEADPALAAAFAEAFAGQENPVTAENFGIAVGAFERTLVTKSRWDTFLGGDRNALSNEEQQGLKDFMDLNCTQCHMTRLLGGNMYQKLGVYKPYSGEDTGRMQVTGNEAEKYMFKVPSLLNVEKTAPYYHDGSMPTLEEAVRDMAVSQLDKKIDDDQVESIVAFLKALTGELPAQPAAK